ncbi:MAG: YggT family protein [Aggregatilineales bacterium]
MSIGSILINLLTFYNFLVLARVLLSYFPNVDYSNPIVRILFDVTEPVLAPIREFIREQFPESGMIDFSPIVLWIIILMLIQVIGIIF